MFADFTHLKKLNRPGVEFGLHFPLRVVDLDQLGVVPEALFVVGSKPNQRVAVLQVVVRHCIFLELHHLSHGRERVNHGFTFV